MISIYCQACKCQNQVFCYTLHTFKVSEVCNTGKSMAFWFQKGDFPNNKGKIMKTGGFLLQKKLKSHLMHNPPPIFVGNFRTCWKLQQYLFQVWLHEVSEGVFMIFLFAFMCVYIYIRTLHEFAQQGFLSQMEMQQNEFLVPSSISCPKLFRKNLTCTCEAVFFSSYGKKKINSCYRQRTFLLLLLFFIHCEV